MYSDFRTYRLQGADRLPEDVRREVARWILFLKTDLPYEWPISGRLAHVGWVFGAVATLGLTQRWRNRRFRACGEISVWPFFRAADYEAALRSAPYLAGTPARERSVDSTGATSTS